MGAGGAKIVPIAIAIFVYIHYNACAIFYSGEIHDFFGWTLLWMKRENASFWESYIFCFMLAVGNMFPMSFKPQTLVEQFAAIIFSFVGAGLYAVLVGYISSAAMSIDNSGRIYNQKMEELVDYIKWRKLNDETKDKLVQYYETKYRGKYFEEDELLGDMNEALRTEISLQNTRELIYKVPFLRREMNDHRNEIFYSRIASVLHVRYYIPGDCVTKQGESGTEMFFVLSGKLDVLIDGNRQVSLYDGAYFGEVALITRALRTATVQARMPSVLYRLTYQDFHSVISEFPDMQIRISELVTERIKLLRIAEDERREQQGKPDP
ncbi:cyclic nucleotide-binding-like protein [Obelidium mucronatum]|nr:cyclic nucleotide-binding-like protein [Obelidium mucronatum]